MERPLHPPTEASGDPDGVLLRRFLLGEIKMVAQVEAMISRVVRYRGYFIPTQDRQDVVQEAMLKLYEALGRPDFAFTRSFRAFVESMAHRRCVDWMRQQRPKEQLPETLPDRAASPDQTVLQDEQREIGQQVLRELREACRKLIRLHAVENLTYREIARLQGRSEGALRVQMYECMREARRILDRIGHRPQRVRDVHPRA